MKFTIKDIEKLIERYQIKQNIHSNIKFLNCISNTFFNSTMAIKLEPKEFLYLYMILNENNLLNNTMQNTIDTYLMLKKDSSNSILDFLNLMMTISFDKIFKIDYDVLNHILKNLSSHPCTVLTYALCIKIGKKPIEEDIEEIFELQARILGRIGQIKEENITKISQILGKVYYVISDNPVLIDIIQKIINNLNLNNQTKHRIFYRN